MNGINIITDTNILLLILAGGKLVLKYLGCNIYIYEITGIELLGDKNITETQYKNRSGLMSNCSIVDLSDSIKRITINLKQQNNIKIPDAIIAATSLFLNFPLVTADKDFKKIKELDLKLIDRSTS